MLRIELLRNDFVFYLCYNVIKEIYMNDINIFVSGEILNFQKKILIYLMLGNWMLVKKLKINLKPLMVKWIILIVIIFGKHL